MKSETKERLEEYNKNKGQSWKYFNSTLLYTTVFIKNWYTPGGLPFQLTIGNQELILKAILGPVNLGFVISEK